MHPIKERLFSILNGKIPERLPWFGDLSYWHFAMEQQGRLEKRYQGYEGRLNMHRDLDCGYYVQGYYSYMPEYNNCEVVEVKREVEGYGGDQPLYKGLRLVKKEGNNDMIREISTPLGNIKEYWPYLENSYTWGPKELFIKTADDLKVFQYWTKNTSYKPDYKKIDFVKEKVGDFGCMLCYLPRSPLMTLILNAGISTTINLMMDYRELFDETIKVLDHNSGEAIEISLPSLSEIFMIPENLSSDIVGKRLYEEYMLPYEEKWTKKINSVGKFSLIHFDGYLKGLLKEVSNAGFSIIEGMTPEPVGDLKVEEFDEYVRSESIMWGGIPGTLFMEETSEEDFIEFVIRVIKIMVSKPKYVLGIADSIPPNGIIERVKLISELVEKYGIYEQQDK